MIKLKLQGEKVVGFARVEPTYQPQENEVLIEAMPKCNLAHDEIGYIRYRNGSVEYEIKKRG